VHQAAARPAGLVDAGRVGCEQSLCGDLGEEEEQRIAGPLAGELVGVDHPLPGLEFLRGRRDGHVVGLRPLRDHVGQQEHQQRDAEEHQPAGREIRLQERTADHHRVEEHPRQEQAGHHEQPDEADLLGVGVAASQAVLDGEQPGRQEDESHEVEIPHAEDAVELEEQRDRQQRRQVEPRRGVHAVVMEEDVAHGRAGTGMVENTRSHRVRPRRHVANSLIERARSAVRGRP
jgi:hypothetical protein